MSSSTSIFHQQNHDDSNLHDFLDDGNQSAYKGSSDFFPDDATNTHDEIIHTKVDRLLESTLDSISSENFMDNAINHSSFDESNKQLERFEPRKDPDASDSAFHQSIKRTSSTFSQVHSTKFCYDKIIKNLRHDLRNSLHPIVNLLPILYSTSDVHQNTKVIQVLHRNMENLQNLVEKSILLTQIKSPSVQCTHSTFPFCRVVDEILLEKRDSINAKQLQILREGDEQMYLTSDFTFLKQALTHIMDNAIRFTPFDGMIFIRVQRKTHTIHVSIRDTGIGMKPEQLHHVFDEFYKVDESRHDLSSNGLGLSISKYIIEKIGGSIRIESPGVMLGSTVHLIIPLKPVS
jgi:signal transduction histidine kinase